MRDHERNTVLVDAIVARNSPAVRMLLLKGADVNSIGDCDSTPLFWAGLVNHLEILEMLIHAGADLTHRNHAGTVLCTAALQYPSIVRRLLEAGVDPRSANYEGELPLEIAIGAGFKDSADVIRAFMER